MVQCITICFGNLGHYWSHGVEPWCKQEKKNIEIMKRHVESLIFRLLVLEQRLWSQPLHHERCYDYIANQLLKIWLNLSRSQPRLQWNNLCPSQWCIVTQALQPFPLSIVQGNNINKLKVQNHGVYRTLFKASTHHILFFVYIDLDSWENVVNNVHRFIHCKKIK